MKWRLYYDDGTTFSDEDGKWDDAPMDGVQGVVITDKETGRKVIQAKDFYFMKDDSINFTDDLNPLLRQLKFIKFGRWMPNKEWKGTLKKMIEDSDFPRKSADHKEENL